MSFLYLLFCASNYNFFLFFYHRFIISLHAVLLDFFFLLLLLCAQLYAECLGVCSTYACSSVYSFRHKRRRSGQRKKIEEAKKKVNFFSAVARSLHHFFFILCARHLTLSFELDLFYLIFKIFFLRFVLSLLL